MDILVSRTLYMSCQAGPGIEPGPSALKASALPIELTWQNTGCTSDVQVSAKHNTQIPGPAIYTENPDSHLTQT